MAPPPQVQYGQAVRATRRRAPWARIQVRLRELGGLRRPSSPSRLGQTVDWYSRPAVGLRRAWRTTLTNQARYAVGCDWRLHRRTDAVVPLALAGSRALCQGTCRWRHALGGQPVALRQKLDQKKCSTQYSTEHNCHLALGPAQPLNVSSLNSTAQLRTSPPLTRLLTDLHVFPLVVLPLRPLSRQRPAG